jgi:hypothetical protein
MKTSFLLLILMMAIAVVNVIWDKQLNQQHSETLTWPRKTLHSSMNTPGTTDDIWVTVNCHALQTAVEAYARINEGLYPSNVDLDKTSSGETVIDFLPGGIRLKNPFTGMATEPINGHATNPGQIGYMALTDAMGHNASYRITGWGKDSLVVEITKRN